MCERRRGIRSREGEDLPLGRKEMKGGEVRGGEMENEFAKSQF